MTMPTADLLIIYRTSSRVVTGVANLGDVTYPRGHRPPTGPPYVNPRPFPPTAHGRRTTTPWMAPMSTTKLSLPARLAILAVAAVGASLALPPPAAHAAGATTYYVSPSGSDSNNGTSPGSAIQSLGRASGLPLNPGDQVLLQRGATFSGKLAVWRSGTAGAPITIGAYGSGNKPVVTGDCLEVGGSYITMTDFPSRTAPQRHLDRRHRQRHHQRRGDAQHPRHRRGRARQEHQGRPATTCTTTTGWLPTPPAPSTTTARSAWWSRATTPRSPTTPSPTTGPRPPTSAPTARRSRSTAASAPWCTTTPPATTGPSPSWATTAPPTRPTPTTRSPRACTTPSS